MPATAPRSRPDDAAPRRNCAPPPRTGGWGGRQPRYHRVACDHAWPPPSDLVLSHPYRTPPNPSQTAERQSGEHGEVVRQTRYPDVDSRVQPHVLTEGVGHAGVEVRQMGAARTHWGDPVLH